MSQKNMGRLAQDMKREIIAIIGRLKDPRLEGGLLTVTRLDVTPDLDVAKVYVSVMGREDGPKPAIERDGIVITEDEIASLKRFKDDVKEVAEGYECGVTLAKFADVKEGDVYEAFKMEEYRD